LKPTSFSVDQPVSRNVQSSIVAMLSSSPS
jgi:hypothetical protein